MPMLPYGRKASPILYDVMRMIGGWDLMSPTFELTPGYLRDIQNFEVSAVKGGGYTRIAGYERFDGRPSPSDGTYTLLQITSYTNTPSVGQTLTGNTSTATGVITVVAATYMIVTKVTGTFSNTETVNVGATLIGTLTATTTTLSSLLDAQYTNGAADVYRADIGVVPGSGAVRGVVTLAVAGVDKVYAFRNNAGGTAVDIYVASSSGWTAVPLFYEISFTAGAVATPADGATLTQGGVTATVKRVMLQTGEWTGAGTGRLIITAPSGGNFAAGAATLSGGATCTLSGVQTAITILPGGRFDFDVGNFSGQATTIRVYGCDGVNRGFEFDGTTYAPIATGATTDTPSRVKIHKNHLFFAFGSSIIHSGPAKPFKFAVADGASEIAVGDTITNYLSQPGSQTAASLGVTTTNNTMILYGSNESDWNLVTHNTGVGGIAFTAQLMNQNFWLDDPGIVNMYTSQNFGNFEQSTISNRIQDYILTQRSKVACSGLNRLKSQYRLHFTDGSGIYATIVNGRMQGIAKVLFPDAMYCAWSGSNIQSNEVSYVGGATSGYVYQLDKGTSCDGANIEAYLVFVWNSMRTPRVLKRYRKASVEISSNFYTSFDFGYALSYQTGELVQASTKTYESGVTGVDYWDAFTWDSFVWDGATLVPAEIEVFGSGVNIQTGISLSSDYVQPFTVNSIIYHYSPRRGVR